MEIVGRASSDRPWRSAQPARRGALPRGCVRAVAFNEPARKPQPISAAAAAPHTSTSQTSPVEPLTIDRISSLQPDSLATALFEYSQQHAPVSSSSSSSSTTRTPSDGDPRIFDAVARNVALRVSEFDAHSLVDILHAYSLAGQGRSNRDFLAICSVALSAQMEELPPASLACLAASCAAMELQPTDMLSTLCTRAHEMLPHFAAPDLVTLLASLAQLQHRSPTLFADAADVLSTELQLPPGPGGLELRDVVAAVWAYAAEGLYHRPLFDGASSLLMGGLEQLDGNSLAKIAWSYATIRHADEGHRGVWDRDLFDGVASTCLQLGPRIAAFPPRALVTLLWSFSSIPHYDAGLFDAVGSALAPHLGACSPSDLVAVAWSVMRVGHKHVELMPALGEAALGCVDRLDGDDLTTIAMAFPAAKAYSEGFFKYLVTEAQERPQFFGQVALLDIIRLISRVQSREPDFYGPALQVLLEHVHQAFLDAPLDKPGCMNPFRFG